MFNFKKAPVNGLNSSPAKRLLLTAQEKNFLDTQEEEERNILTEGMCFGEWGIIYNIPRTASAYSLEQTYLFSLDKEVFLRSLNVLIC